jgi:cytochrome c5
MQINLILSSLLCSSGGTHAAARNGVRDSAAQEVSTVEDVLGQTSDGQAVFELACRTCDIDAAE